MKIRTPRNRKKNAHGLENWEGKVEYKQNSPSKQEKKQRSCRASAQFEKGPQSQLKKAFVKQCNSSLFISVQVILPCKFLHKRHHTFFINMHVYSVHLLFK